ncbi:hypothetical protein ONS95_006967 [Cadophora gregata]|uniref:uncharacterized protein n=1 Tax=Cadophora gregata TaxID=51156 RepID=UPI0026DB1087|nr:uncharacterized protein ONS95_006967 [Cadophora gregata]KAK0101817.1 hypothetical protein ONS95_006967 [Cadophora gregata]KAK0106165.1 hypothetical protein ONS96_003812 [Cadophora gregata f. sp. sojae]
MGKFCSLINQDSGYPPLLRVSLHLRIQPKLSESNNTTSFKPPRISKALDSEPLHHTGSLPTLMALLADIDELAHKAKHQHGSHRKCVPFSKPGRIPFIAAHPGMLVVCEF